MNAWKWCVPMAALAVAATALAAGKPSAKGGKDAMLRRGAYLVSISGCHDCHTPWKTGPSGPEPDRSRLLSGHPEGLAVKQTPEMPHDPWAVLTTWTFTAWAGPWGTSFAANLTPDPETGIGSWTERQFIESMRTGRHMGQGRPILPPMPWPNVAKMTDEDLKATFAYLQSIPAIRNRVPDPIPPDEAAPEPAEPAKPSAR